MRISVGQINESGEVVVQSGFLPLLFLIKPAAKFVSKSAKRGKLGLATSASKGAAKGVEKGARDVARDTTETT